LEWAIVSQRLAVACIGDDRFPASEIRINLGQRL